MPIVVSALLFILWMAVAYREYQRGDLLLAGICALVGILLSLYRLKVWQTRQGTRRDDQSPL
jgi:hypothetical protein